MVSAHIFIQYFVRKGIDNTDITSELNPFLIPVCYQTSYIKLGKEDGWKNLTISW